MVRVVDAEDLPRSGFVQTPFSQTIASQGAFAGAAAIKPAGQQAPLNRLSATAGRSTRRSFDVPVPWFVRGPFLTGPQRCQSI